MKLAGLRRAKELNAHDRARVFGHWLQAPRAVKRHATVQVSGAIMNVVAPTSVSLYERHAGAKKSKLVATVPVTMTSSGQGLFFFAQKNLKKTTRFTVIWNGDASDLGATAAAVVKVRVK